MSRLVLLLVGLLLLSQTVTASFSCPIDLLCYCFASSQSVFSIHCATNATAAFGVNYHTDELVRIQCKNGPDWMDFLLGATLDMGSTRRFVFSSCTPPGPKYSRRVVRQMNMNGVQHLVYENMQGTTLTPEDLAAFPEVKHLVLSNNRLGHVSKDLLKGLSNLKQLEMRNAQLQIPDGLFEGAGSLKSLELSGNGLGALKPGIFDGLKSLELLNLWKNDLGELQTGALRNLSSLVSLDLHQNNLRTLPVDVFADLGNLEIINLSANNVSALPEGLFQHNPKLRVLKLLFNRANLTELPAGLLGGLTNLKLVSLVRCGLRRLPDDLLWGSYNLVDINLSRNYLTTLPKQLLRDTVELHSLSLAFNDLKDLPEGLFEASIKLVKLDLSKNHLRTINENTLVGLESLQELNVENNDLFFIQIDAFSSLGELKVAKFSNNKLTLGTSVFDTFGQVSPFHHCRSLEELYLSHNSINEIYSDWIISSTRLSKLDLSYNSFGFLESEDLQFMSSSISVDLRHNAIVEVNLASLEYISSNQSVGSRDVRVLLEENPLQCDCELHSLLRYLDAEMMPAAVNYVRLDLGETRCNGPDYMRGQVVVDLRARDLKCLVQSEESQEGDPCAPGAACDCWLRPDDRALLLDCSERNLTAAPAWIEAHGVDRVELDLTRNRLRFGPLMTASGYEKVTTLNLAENLITVIEESLLSPNLEVLHLDGNNLTSIDLAVLEKLSNSSHITKLTLHDNPWRCDCSTRDLLSFVQSNFLELPELLNISCSNGNVSLSNLSLDELCPSSTRFFIILCAFIGVFGLLLGFAAALYFRFQRQIKVWLYSKSLCLCLVTEDELDREKQYDAFISYSHKDEDFVVNELMAKLEEGPKPYKLCIHIRDWLAGEWIPNQIARSVEESRRTIVVLSPNFIESVWGRMEFQTAHKQALSEKRSRVIVVLYGDIGPTNNLDPELRAYLQMNTYIKWGDPWFWQKLRYAMPHSVGLPKQIISNNESLSSIGKALADKNLEDIKIFYVDENNKYQGIIETVRDINRNFNDKCSNKEDKCCLTV